MNDTDSLSDLDIVARTIDGEAGNQGYEGQQAVACVIMNRVALKWKGDETERAVRLRPAQFSCWLPGPDRDRIMSPSYVAPNTCVLLAGMALSGTIMDITEGADSYIVTGTPCYWAKGLTPVIVIGKHSFYITRPPSRSFDVVT